MTDVRPVLRVGLTGGIASGKTTVAGFLAEMGAFILDADRIAHEIMEPGGPAYEGVVECFGESILDRTRRISRERLGALVFEDTEARKSLNAIVHPLVRSEAEARLDRYLRTGHSAIAVFDAALLVETGMHHSHHKLIVVRCSVETQLRRLLARGSLDAEAAAARIEAQAAPEDRLALADYVIDTETTLRATRRRTREVWESLVEDYEKMIGEEPNRRP